MSQDRDLCVSMMSFPSAEVFTWPVTILPAMAKSLPKCCCAMCDHSCSMVNTHVVMGFQRSWRRNDEK